MLNYDICSGNRSHSFGCITLRRCAWKEGPLRDHHSETDMPPDMTQEQTWAWEMDNFEALSHPSSQQSWCCGPVNPSIARLLDEAAFEKRGDRNAVESHMERSQWLRVQRDFGVLKK